LTEGRILRSENLDAANSAKRQEQTMKTNGKLLSAGAAALTLLFGGCTGGYYSSGPYEGPYIGGFGPYGYGGGGGFVIGTSHYENQYGNHHFYGRSFGARHIAVANRSGGFHHSNGASHSGHGGGHH
jgi:hypothetical protein